MTDRRDELLAGATAWVVTHGLSALSLRPLAAALNTSDRMLVYYFGSKDGLVAAIAEAAASGLAGAMPVADPAYPPSSAWVWLLDCWTLFSDPAVRPALALLFEFDAHGIRGDPTLQPAARAVGDRWIAAVDDGLAALGVRNATRRRGLTKVVAAAMVGLILDALLDPEPSTPMHEIALLACLIDAERLPAR